MKTKFKKLVLAGFVFFVSMLFFGQNGNAYIDPSVMTYMIQVVAGIVVAVGAVAGIYVRKIKREVSQKLGIDEFYYSSGISEAVISASVDVKEVDALIQTMNQKNLYLIARIPSFQDYSFALKHVNSGIPFTGGGGALWMDSEGCYWLKPTDSAAVGWLTSIILELRGLGFDEVVLDEFMVPDSPRVVYKG